MNNALRTLVLAVIPATILAISIAWTFRYQMMRDFVMDKPVVMDRWTGVLYAVANPRHFERMSENHDVGMGAFSLNFTGVAVDFEK